MSFREKQEFDVLIIGGGIIGLSIARELKKNGVKHLAVLEKNSICGTEASSAAAGMLAPQAEADCANDFFRLCQQSRNLYPKFTGELRDETGVDAELDQTGTLYLAVSEIELAELEQRFNWQQNADLPVERLTQPEVLKLEPNLSSLVLGGLRFPLDWQVENRKLVAALKTWQTKNQIKVFNEAAVGRVQIENQNCITIETSLGEFAATSVVIAAGAWSSQFQLPGVVPNFNVKPILGQMLSFKSDEKVFKHVVYSHSVYLVPRFDNRNLIGASIEDVGFKRILTPEETSRLLDAAHKLSARICSFKLLDNWCGLRPKTPDGLPLLGEYPKDSGLYFATGHYRNGILLAPITAQLIADKIVHRIDSPFLQIFNPNRFAMNANFSCACQNFF